MSESLDDDYEYEIVSGDEEILSADLAEDLDCAVRYLQEAENRDKDEPESKDDESPKPTVIEIPEPVEDFIGNFLVRMGMKRSLNHFLTEWYEMEEKGLLEKGKVEMAHDVYRKVIELEDKLKMAEKENLKYKSSALKAEEIHVKLRKQRDFHRMHHRRVVQEKNKLITENKRLKSQYVQYEPTLQLYQMKYEKVLKEKMLVKIELERSREQCISLVNKIKNFDLESDSLKGTPSNAGELIRTNRLCGIGGIKLDNDGLGPTQRALLNEKVKEPPPSIISKPRSKDSKFPADPRENPYLLQPKGLSSHSIRTGGFKLTKTVPVHKAPVSSVCLHPKKQIMATTSDDMSWKLWSVPACNLIGTGEGHTDWVSDCDFNVEGSKLVTSSGDGTIRIWNFESYACVQTFKDHQLAVWSCTWHWAGDFVASASRDSTSKVWDLNSQRCRYTLRGHTDSVNSIEFVPFSNILLTSSSDKTISMWDARTGLCGQTFYGHEHGINNARINNKGDTVASCDALGTVKIWDTRKVATMFSFEVGNFSVNKVSFDPTSSVLAMACDDHTIKMYDIATGQLTSLIGHENAVQCMAFDHLGQFLASGGSDYTMRIWN